MYFDNLLRAAAIRSSVSGLATIMAFTFELFIAIVVALFRTISIKLPLLLCGLCTCSTTLALDSMEFLPFLFLAFQLSSSILSLTINSSMVMYGV